MNHIDEAKELYEIVKKANGLFGENKYKESEVSFRFDALKGMLIMATNDIASMYIEWKEE